MEDFSIVDAPKKYDISFIQKSEDGVVVRQLVEKYGGTILNERPVVKIRLSYPIKKETQGFLGNIECILSSDSVARVSTDARLNADLLRFMVGIRKEIKEGEDNRGDAVERSQKRKKNIVVQKTKSGFSSTLSNEALQEKLEEILQ
jgi:ribosomal protein S6